MQTLANLAPIQYGPGAYTQNRHFGIRPPWHHTLSSVRPSVQPANPSSTVHRIQLTFLCASSTPKLLSAPSEPMLLLPPLENLSSWQQQACAYKNNHAMNLTHLLQEHVSEGPLHPVTPQTVIPLTPKKRTVRRVPISTAPPLLTDISPLEKPIHSVRHREWLSHIPSAPHLTLKQPSLEIPQRPESIASVSDTHTSIIIPPPPVSPSPRRQVIKVTAPPNTPLPLPKAPLCLPNIHNDDGGWFKHIPPAPSPPKEIQETKDKPEVPAVENALSHNTPAKKKKKKKAQNKALASTTSSGVASKDQISQDRENQSFIGCLTGLSKKSSDARTSLMRDIKIPDVVCFSLLYFDQIFGRYIVLDTESTGLGNGHKITEVGCVILENLKITGEQFHMFVNPQRLQSEPARQLTGYTDQFLSHQPLFGDVAHHLLRFLRDDPLIIHNAWMDLRWLNDALTKHLPHKIEDKRVIVDTHPFAHQLHPNPQDKKDLTSLCQRYSIDVTRRTTHGALIDAQLLAELFCAMLKSNQSLLPEAVTWDKLPRILFFERFASLKGTVGQDFFRGIGFHQDLPEAFRFESRMYHPTLRRHYPAILTAFKSTDQEVAGILVRYIHPCPIDVQKIKHFYGSAYNAWVDIYTRSSRTTGYPTTVCIGTLPNCLVLREFLLGVNDKKICDALKTQPDELSIRACLETSFLPSMRFDEHTKQIIFLLDNNGRNDRELLSILKTSVERYCYKDFVSCDKVLASHQDVRGWFAKYAYQDWLVVADQATTTHKQRYITLEHTSTSDQKILHVDLNRSEVRVDHQTLADVQAFLLAKPLVTLKAIVLKTELEEKTPLSMLVKETPEKIIERVCQPVVISSLKDLSFLEKIEYARRLYANALAVNLHSPIMRYFHKRGITVALPDSFRYLEQLYHPWMEASFPALLVPLYNAHNTLMGIHRIFCNPDGSPLAPSGDRRTPVKLSLGRVVGTAAHIHHAAPKRSERAGVVLVSEGIENALVVKEVMHVLAQKNPSLMKKLYAQLNITDTFSIKACVGINGLINAPLDPQTHTVVILADRDGDDNVQVKETMRNTVTLFLHKGLKVKIVMPTGSQKCDLNDLFLEQSLDRHQKIAETLYGAVQIDCPDDLGEDHEPLHDSLRRISATRLKDKPKDELQDDPKNAPRIDATDSAALTLNIPGIVPPKSRISVPKSDIPVVSSNKNIPDLNKSFYDLMAHMVAQSPRIF